MTTVVRKSSSAFQSSKTVTTSSSTTHTGNTRDDTENGCSHEKSESLLEDMLREMSLEHQKIMDKQFKGDADEITKYYENILREDFLEDGSTQEMLAIDEDQTKPFEVELKIEGYSPNEVKVTTRNNMVNVDAKHEEKEGGQTFVARQFSRKFSLPANVRPEHITSSYTDGLLKITGKKTPRKDSKTQQVTTHKRKNSTSEAVNHMLETVKDKYEMILEKYFQGDVEAMVAHYESILKREFPNDKFMPIYLKSLCKRANVSDQGITEFDDRFEIKVDVHEFKSTEVNIRHYYNYIIVEGRHSARKNTPGKSMKKRYQLPTGFDFAAMVSSRSKDGIMTIVLPKRRKSIPGTYITRPLVVKKTVRKPSTPSTDSHESKSPRCAACARRAENRLKNKK